jgi:hypothetical protein
MVDLTISQRGMSKANMLQPVTYTDEREYADAYTQYDPSFFYAASSSQTEPEPVPITASVSMQTEEPTVSVSEVQTEEPFPRVTVDSGIQTEVIETGLATSRSPSPLAEEEEAMASSSSTVLPPTPKAKATSLLSTDLPPSYNTVAPQSLFHNLEHLLDTSDPSFAHITDPEARRELVTAMQTLKQYHKGLDAPIRSGVILSAELAEDWRALKQELGLNCAVIDKAVAEANVQPRKDMRSPRLGRFYNIYNTYVYGSGSSSGGGMGSTWLSQLLVAGTASVIVFAAMSPFLVQQHVIPGGPTYYDRAAWQSFNSIHAAGEGFGNDGTTVVWSFLGRLGGGAARAVRNWPT